MWALPDTGGLAKKKKKVAGPPKFTPFVAPDFSGVGVPQAGPRPMANPYAGLLNDYVNQQRADMQGQSAFDRAGMEAAIKRYLISYGEIPDFAQMGISGSAKDILGSLLGGDLKALADKNTAEGLSVKARLEQADTIAKRQIPASLAGRGLLRSGQTGYDLGQQALKSKQTGFDVLNEMLGNIEGQVSSFQQAEAARARALADAEMQARMAAMGDYGGDIGWEQEGAAMGGQNWFAPLGNVSGQQLLQWASSQGAPKKKKAPPRAGRLMGPNAFNPVRARRY